MRMTSDDIELPLAAVERIMRNAGAEKVSADAVKLLQDSTHGLGQELAEDAVRIARQAESNTVTARHIDRAVSGE